MEFRLNKQNYNKNETGLLKLLQTESMQPEVVIEKLNKQYQLKLEALSSAELLSRLINVHKLPLGEMQLLSDLFFRLASTYADLELAKKCRNIAEKALVLYDYVGSNSFTFTYENFNKTEILKEYTINLK